MQIIAMVTMLLDHIGLIWFPQDDTWRIIGRLAMPLYAYALVIGYFRTKNINQYFWRMTAIAALSQIPYSLAFGTWEINTVGTLLVCLVSLKLLDQLKSRPALQVSLAAFLLLLLEVVPCSYGAYLLVLVLIYRYVPKHGMAPAHLLLNIFYLFYMGWTIQLFSVVATLLLVYSPSMLQAADSIKVPRSLWRSFYPLHLAIIAALQYVILAGK